MPQPLIQTNNLCFSYQNDDKTVEVLHSVDLSVHQGEFVAVLGHNGSGKSTLAKLCNAILTPASGTVLVEGIDTSQEEMLFEVRSRVGMVFQNPDNQLVATLVEEDVAFAPENLGVPPKEIRKRVDDALAAVDMTAYAGHSPHQLSGGQKQRVAIAGVLAMQPDCILLDEATAMLDPRGRREVLSTIRRLNREQGTTILHITHFMEEAALADRVVVVSDGRVLLDGTPKEVFSRADLLQGAGLGVPQVTQLVDALVEEGLLPEQTVLSVDECVELLARLLEE